NSRLLYPSHVTPQGTHGGISDAYGDSTEPPAMVAMCARSNSRRAESCRWRTRLCLWLTRRLHSDILSERFTNCANASRRSTTRHQESIECVQANKPIKIARV